MSFLLSLSLSKDYVVIFCVLLAKRHMDYYCLSRLDSVLWADGRTRVYLPEGWAPCPFKTNAAFGSTSYGLSQGKAIKKRPAQHTEKDNWPQKRKNNSELMLMFYILFFSSHSSSCPFSVGVAISTKVTYWFVVKLLELVMIWNDQDGHPSSDGIESHQLRESQLLHSFGRSNKNFDGFIVQLTRLAWLNPQKMATIIRRFISSLLALLTKRKTNELKTENKWNHTKWS